MRLILGGWWWRYKNQREYWASSLIIVRSGGRGAVIGQESCMSIVCLSALSMAGSVPRLPGRRWYPRWEVSAYH